MIKIEKWKGVRAYVPTFPDGAIMIKVDDNIERPVAIVPYRQGDTKKEQSFNYVMRH